MALARFLLMSSPECPPTSPLMAPFMKKLPAGAASRVEGELGGSVATTGTADKDFAFVLRVQIDEIVARHKAGLHALGTRKPGLFIAGEHTLQRAMLDVIAVEDGQFDGTAYTVVSTQGGALCSQPLAVDIGADGISVEVELHIYELVAYHVHVALQDDGLPVFHARRSSLADNHVTRFVDFGVEIAALTPVLKILNHLLFALRRTRNFVNLRKLFEDNRRF